jgi:phage shock protein PspC (stress-responsive transcriptional regulator)
MENKLYRNTDDSTIFGVCSGLAEHLNMDVSIVRILFVLIFFSSFPIGIIYIIMALVVPEKPKPTQ